MTEDELLDLEYRVRRAEERTKNLKFHYFMSQATVCVFMIGLIVLSYIAYRH